MNTDELDIPTQLALMVRSLERVVLEDSADVATMILEFRDGLTDDAVAFVDSDEVTSYVEQVFKHQDHLADLLDFVFGTGDTLVKKFSVGFMEGR